MIRRRLRRRWTRGLSDGEILLRSMNELHDRWDFLDRYNEWHVARYGERGELRRIPYWQRIVDRVECWLMDWRSTLAQRKVWMPKPPVTLWECGQPPDGAHFTVLRETWSLDGRVRTIHEIKLHDVSPTTPRRPDGHQEPPR